METEMERMASAKFAGNEQVENDDDDDDGEDENEDGDSNGDDKEDYEDKLQGVYDPSKYDSLDVSPEVRSLFSFITHYTPQMIEITAKLKPFIPDYIPAVGDVDVFIKIPFPSGAENSLGLTTLDEPSIEQSDPAVLRLKLKAVSKEVKEVVDKTDQHSSAVKSSGSGREIDTWIENIRHLHERTARPDSVSLMHNHQRMDIDELMQEWAEEVENALNVHSIPPADLDCSLEEYINMLCAILDIPVQSNRIVSLYLLFTLYNEFQNSQHFRKI